MKSFIIVIIALICAKSMAQNTTQVFKIEGDGEICITMPVDSFYSCEGIDSLRLIKKYQVPYFRESDYQIEVYEDARFNDLFELPRIIIKKGQSIVVDMWNGCNFCNWNRVYEYPSEEYVQYVPLSPNLVLAMFTTYRDGTCQPSPGNITIVALTANDAKLVFCKELEFEKIDVSPDKFRLIMNTGCDTPPRYTLWQEGERILFKRGK